MPSFLPVVLLTVTVLGATQTVRGNLLEELDGSQQLQSAAPVPSAGGSPAQAPADVNSADGLKPSAVADTPVPSSPSQPEPAARQMGTGCSGNGPALNLAPGAYIQFKVAVPPGFFARLDETPDGGKMITVISPEPPCPKCALGRGMEQQPSSGVNSFDGTAPQPTPQLTNPPKIIQNYQESVIQRGGAPVPSAGNPNYSQQYASPDVSSMYVKNSAYRKVQVSGAQLPYQARSRENFPPPPPQPSYRVQPLPLQQRPTSTQYQQVPQTHQTQYTQVSGPEYPPPLQPQPSSNVQYVQQPLELTQTQFNSLPAPSPQPVQNIAALENFHKAVRSLDDE